ncbi:MAG: SRPBCC family protein [Acidimicrobiia bacterium]
MISFTNTVHIERHVEEVFAYLADLEHTPEWNWAITETKKITPGPISVGTRYRQMRSVPQAATEDLEVTVLQPNRRIDVEGTLAQLPAHLTYQLEETDTGTRLTNTVVLEPQGALRVAGPLVGGRIKRAVADNLGQLKALLEGGTDSRN